MLKARVHACWLRMPMAFIAGSYFCTGSLAEEVLDTALLGDKGVVFEGQVDVQWGIEDAQGIGDFDGDGFDDVLLSPVEMRMEGETESLSVTIMLVYGRPGLTGKHALDSTLPRTLLFRQAGFRAALAPAGDVNADGYSDLFLGQRYFLQEGQNRGQGVLLYGGRGLEGERRVADIGVDLPGVTLWSSDTADRLVGTALENIGDFNGDGEDDLAIGAAEWNGGGREHGGRLFILLKSRDLPLRVDLNEIGRTLPGIKVLGAMRWDSEAAGPIGENLGEEVAGVQDVDRDGFDDVLVKAKAIFAPSTPSYTYLIYGSPASPQVIDLQTVADGGEIAGVTLIIEPMALPVKDFSGTPIGDMNGDGYADILFGAPTPYHPLRATYGAAYIFYGSNTHRREIDFNKFEPGMVTRFIGLKPGDGFGAPVAAAGDLNEDGVPDLLVGATNAFRDGMRSVGEAFAIHGRRDFGPEVRLSEAFSGIRFLGEDSFDDFGAVRTAGDFNGDGHQDVLILAPHLYTGIAGPAQARAYLIYGTGGTTRPLELTSLEPAWGPLRGGTQVVLRGQGFEGSPVVRFGAREAPSVEVLSSSELRAVTPPGEGLGFVDVSVEIGGGSARLPGAFEYVKDRPEIDLSKLSGAGLIVQADLVRKIYLPSLALGDATGDGVDDLIVETTDSSTWNVTVVKGGPSLPPVLPASTPSGEVTVIGQSSSAHGRRCGVWVAGDVNGDGVGDLMVSTVPSPNVPAAAIVFGKRDLPPEVDFDALEIQEDKVRIELVHPDVQRFIAAVAPLGDLTGDGIDDFALRLNEEWVDPGAVPGAGAIVYVAGRREWPEVFDLGDPGFVFGRIVGSRRDQYLGVGLQNAGDVNGDGLVDLIAGTAVRQDIKVGRAYVLHGRREMPLGLDVDRYVLEGGGAAIDVLAEGFRLHPGFYVSGAGDVNADGYGDVLLGVESGGPDFEGMSYLIHGGPDLAEHIEVKEEPEAPDGILRILGEGSQEFAAYVVPAGDFDGDGYDDFVIGAPNPQQQDPSGQSPGNVFLVFGGESLPERIDLGDLRGHGIKINGVKPGGILGIPQGVLGDLNGDGRTDFAFVEHEVLTQVDGNRVYVIYGQGPDLRFLRGDANGDGRVEIADPIFGLTYLFLGGPAPPCEDALDADDSGVLDVTDPIYILNHLFQGGPAPRPPHPFLRADPTPDRLHCPGT